jgi:subtilisin
MTFTFPPMLRAAMIPTSYVSTFSSNASALLFALAVVAAVALAPRALAQPDIRVEPGELLLEVESRFVVTDTLFVTNDGDATLLVSATTEVDEFPDAPTLQARKAPALHGRDLRLQGSYSAGLQALFARADAGASVRVIVELDVAFAPEGYLPSGQATAQRADIQARQAAVLDVLAGSGTDVIHRYKYTPALALRVRAEGLRRLAAHPAVVRIVMDRMMGPSLEESTVVVGAPTAWDLGFGGEGQAVAVLDSGVDNDHPFLSDKIVSEACFSNGFSSTNTSLCPSGATEEIGPGAGDDYCQRLGDINQSNSQCDHGTHVAGISAGSTGGFHGVARDADIVAIQVFSRVDSLALCSSFGYGTPCALASFSDAIAGFEHVFMLADDGMQVASANMSLGWGPGPKYGGYVDAPCPDAPMEPIAAQLTSIGVAVVAASGNDGADDGMVLPACAPSVISAGSTGDGSFGAPLDGVSGFSNVASFLDLYAPGSRIRSSVPGGGYANFAGTSMAAPHVAGAFAILKGADPGISVERALGALKVSGIPIATHRIAEDHSRIQIDYALSALEWLGVPTAEVEVGAGETVAVPVFANALPLRSGTYTGTVLLTSNDPDEPEVAVPVTLTVTPPPPPPVFGLQIESRNPDADVPIAVFPDDVNGEGEGTTPLLRAFEPGAAVTFIASPSSGDNEFAYWTHEGEIFTTQRVDLTLEETSLWTATYIPSDNAAPVANDDIVETPQGQGVEIDVLANDSDPEGGPLVVVGLAGGVNGVADILENNNVGYLPDSDFVGVDTLSYFAADEFGAIDEALVIVYVGVGVGAEDERALPAAFEITGNYPNPFAGSTRLRFDLPEAARVEVTVYDLLGREVLRVAPQAVVAGFGRTLVVEAGALAPGVYVYRVRASTAEGGHVGSGRFAVVH